MSKVFAGVITICVFIGGQVAAQQVAAPVTTPVVEDEYRAPTLGFSGLGDAGPVLLTGLLGAAMIGGIILLGDDDDDTNATNGSGGD